MVPRDRQLGMPLGRRNSGVDPFVGQTGLLLRNLVKVTMTGNTQITDVLIMATQLKFRDSSPVEAL